jgi:pimeloyl-ACP methyl ester carboxylesterase
MAVALDLVDRSSLPFEFDGIAAVLARWIERSFGEPVHVVGNSMGGQIAIHLAAAHPQLVRSLVLVDSSGIPLRFRPLLHLRNLLVPSGALSIARLLLRDFLRTGPVALIRRLIRLFRDDVRPLLPGLSMPVLLVWGAHDAMVPEAYAREMTAAIPGARLAVILRAGHVPMWENPAGFNRELLAFLASVD